MNQLTRLRGLTIIVFSLWMFASVHTSLCGKIGVTTFSTEGSSNGVCPSESVRDYLRSTLQQEVRNQLRTQGKLGYTIQLLSFHIIIIVMTWTDHLKL